MFRPVTTVRSPPSPGPLWSLRHHLELNFFCWPSDQTKSAPGCNIIFAVYICINWWRLLLVTSMIRSCNMMWFRRPHCCCCLAVLAKNSYVAVAMYSSIWFDTRSKYGIVVTKLTGLILIQKVSKNIMYIINNLTSNRVSFLLKIYIPEVLRINSRKKGLDSVQSYVCILRRYFTYCGYVC